ncbi:MAG: hypothetical protein DRP01_00150 [Archaeoglobales archaeon]|nr:MAG: hypothetical protein DRP01_00150 [Archaeoglobales archaeon]
MSQKKIKKDIKELVEKLEVSAPQLLEMIQQQTVTNMHLKILNDALIREVMKGFDSITERLCALEDKAFGENKGAFKLEDTYQKEMQVSPEEAADLRAKLKKYKETS